MTFNWNFKHHISTQFGTHLFCKRWRLNELHRVLYTNLITIRCLVVFCIWRYTNILWHSVWGHIRVHIFNEPISDELTKSVVIKTKYMQIKLSSGWSIYLIVYFVSASTIFLLELFWWCGILVFVSFLVFVVFSPFI